MSVCNNILNISKTLLKVQSLVNNYPHVKCWVSSDRAKTIRTFDLCVTQKHRSLHLNGDIGFGLYCGVYPRRLTSDSIPKKQNLSSKPSHMVFTRNMTKYLLNMCIQDFSCGANFCLKFVWFTTKKWILQRYKPSYDRNQSRSTDKSKKIRFVL